tara:strand:- start:3322 stop:3600 length:279 start_codon:yes stop_codon:yes gene_type:complete
MGKKLFDQYTYLHFAVGIVSFYWDISLKKLIMIHTFFEILENTEIGMKIINQIEYWPGGKLYSDSFINMVGDTIGVIVGWYTASLVNNYFMK